ncbi:malto-oligosyltrehalose synthase [Pseudomonas citronellolis]|uniref:malto-oligosyltrehalose synthase n=1 Tax=Pseudomonas citronellolis TaxID=53408 RepID=UPI0018D748CF|nr:malto-oligosyltrehalose synthase [Pseudomonas citronellolis]MBH3435274.1 malto-oligosyltrehalose synthase [Pseudomonas citronellolis]
MNAIRATLRLQFNRDFTLDDALPWLDYFAELGISHLYASPLLTAQPGSGHGYDVVDPTRINPELGGEAALRRLVGGLRLRGMGLIVDSVANHMRIGQANPWWQDVLKWGLASPYAHFFDIHWRSDDPLLDRQVLLPCLGGDYLDELQAGRIRLGFAEHAGCFQLHYGEHCFPVCPASYGMILVHAEQGPLYELAPRFAELRGHPQARVLATALCRRLAALLGDAALRERLLGFYRVTEGQDWRPLHRLLEHQHYRLANWRVAADDINWRRFFDINELVGLRVELPDVFGACHAYLLQLMREGLVDGLRIDHVDGLADPRGYCRRLRRAFCDGAAPLYVEKILAPGEHLPADWQADGTSGYDFMNQVSLLQHDPRGEIPLRALWEQASGRRQGFDEERLAAREWVLRGAFAGDLEGMAQQLWQLARTDLASRDLPLGSIRRALFQLLRAFPVYRSYAGACGRSAQDRRYFEQARALAAERLDEHDRRTLAWLDRGRGGEPLRAVPPGPLRQKRRQVLARFQQLTPPIAAKALEDTACYRHAAALGRNDVGFDPQRLAAPPADFHAACQARLAQFPRALLATATHDHKRGEDCRARLAALSERAPWFAEQVAQWRPLAAPLRHPETPHAPSGGDELILYQCLLASWPHDLAEDDAEGLRAYHARIAQWQLKALREAKLETDWSAPVQAYESACADFLDALLLQPAGQALRQAIAAAARALMPAGALNGLAQCLLRCTTPGVPDLYQGCEFWDFSLVDPDNRRTPDYARRQAALQAQPDWPQLLQHWRDGRIKQALLRQALQLRRRWPQLFSQGSYQPLELHGEHADCLFGFLRSQAGRHLLVLVPRLCAGLLEDRPQVPPERWGDTRMRLPAELAGRQWQGLAAGHRDDHGELAVAEVLGELPVNLLISVDEHQEASP